MHHDISWYIKTYQDISRYLMVVLYAWHFLQAYGIRHTHTFINVIVSPCRFCWPCETLRCFRTSRSTHAFLHPVAGAQPRMFVWSQLLYVALQRRFSELSSMSKKYWNCLSLQIGVCLVHGWFVTATRDDMHESVLATSVSFFCCRDMNGLGPRFWAWRDASQIPIWFRGPSGQASTIPEGQGAVIWTSCGMFVHQQYHTSRYPQHWSRWCTDVG